MTPVAGSQKTVVSAFTLAAFADMGFYEVDMSLAEPLPWGAKTGCDFSTKKCIGDNGPLLGKKPRAYFCDIADEPLCSLDRKFKGFCNIASWPPAISRAEFQYFSDKSLGGYYKEIDFCPIVSVFSNGNCEDASHNREEDKEDGPKGSAFGERYGTGSRCVESTLLQNGYTSESKRRNSCMMMRCSKPDASANIVVTLYKVDLTTVEVMCMPAEANTEKSPPSGFQGKIVCPDPSIICAVPKPPDVTSVSGFGTGTDNATPPAVTSPGPSAQLGIPSPGNRPGNACVSVALFLVMLTTAVLYT